MVERVTVIQFRMDNGGGNGAGCFEVEIWADTAKFTNVIHNTIQYNSVYLTCSKKLTGSQLSLPHGINRKLKCEIKNKMMSVISPVQSRYHEAVQ